LTVSLSKLQKVTDLSHVNDSLSFVI